MILRSRCKHTPLPIYLDIGMFRGSIITFALGFPIGKSHGWGDSGIVGLDLVITLSSAHYFESAPHTGALS